MTSPDFGSSHVGSCQMTRPHFSVNCLRMGPRQREGGGAPLLLLLLVMIAPLLLIRRPPARPPRPARLPALPARRIRCLHPLIGGV